MPNVRGCFDFPVESMSSVLLVVVVVDGDGVLGSSSDVSGLVGALLSMVDVRRADVSVKLDGGDEYDNRFFGRILHRPYRSSSLAVCLLLVKLPASFRVTAL